MHAKIPLLILFHLMLDPRKRDLHVCSSSNLLIPCLRNRHGNRICPFIVFPRLGVAIWVMFLMVSETLELEICFTAFGARVEKGGIYLAFDALERLNKKTQYVHFQRGNKKMYLIIFGIVRGFILRVFQLDVRSGFVGLFVGATLSEIDQCLD